MIKLLHFLLISIILFNFGCHEPTSSPHPNDEPTKKESEKSDGKILKEDTNRNKKSRTSRNKKSPNENLGKSSKENHANGKSKKKNVSANENSKSYGDGIVDPTEGRKASKDKGHIPQSDSASQGTLPFKPLYDRNGNIVAYTDDPLLLNRGADISSENTHSEEIGSESLEQAQKLQTQDQEQPSEQDQKQERSQMQDQELDQAQELGLLDNFYEKFKIGNADEITKQVGLYGYSYLRHKFRTSKVFGENPSNQYDAILKQPALKCEKLRGDFTPSIASFPLSYNKQRPLKVYDKSCLFKNFDRVSWQSIYNDLLHEGLLGFEFLTREDAPACLDFIISEYFSFIFPNLDMEGIYYDKLLFEFFKRIKEQDISSEVIRTCAPVSSKYRRITS